MRTDAQWQGGQISSNNACIDYPSTQECGAEWRKVLFGVGAGARRSVLHGVGKRHVIEIINNIYTLYILQLDE